MNVRRFIKSAGIALFALCILMAIVWMGLMEYASRELRSRQPEIQALLKEQVGYPVSFSELKTKWSWDSIFISLQEVVIQDAERITATHSIASIPIISAKALHLGTTLPRLLLNRDSVFNRIEIDGLKVTLDWNSQGTLSILGLQGERMAETTPPSRLLEILVNQERVTFRNSHIAWRAWGRTIEQKLSGIFSWKDAKRFFWTFDGKHQVSQNGSAYTSPSPMMLEMDTTTYRLKVKTEIARVKGQCELEFLAQGNEVQGTHPIVQMTRHGGTRETHLRCGVTAGDMNLSTLRTAIALKKSDPDWMHWVMYALERGTMTSLSVQVQGPVNQLDWQGLIQYQDVAFVYSEAWPKITAATGTVKIRSDRLEIEAHKGKITDFPFEKVVATVGPWGVQQTPMVQVAGTLTSRLEQGLDFLKSTPLRETIVPQLASLMPEGAMALRLNLQIPLRSAEASTEGPIQVQGVLQVSEARLALENLKLSIDRVAGVFHFTEQGVMAESVQAICIGQPIKVSVTPQKIQTELSISADFLKDKFNIPVLAALEGQSRMAVAYLNQTQQWQIESDLKGIKIDLPAPLGKAMDATNPTVLTLGPIERGERSLALKMKGMLDFEGTVAEGMDQFELKRGHWVLGSTKNASRISENRILVEGEVNDIEVQAWWRFLERFDPLSRLLPFKLHVWANKFRVFGLEFQKTWVTYPGNSKTEPKWVLEGPALRGSITLPNKKNEAMQLYFDQLEMNQSQKPTSSGSFLETVERIPIRFYSKNIKVKGINLGEVTFKLQPMVDGYDIESLHIRTEPTVITVLEGGGEWKFTKGLESTHLHGKLLSDNMGQTAMRWGYPAPIQGGRGRIQFNLSWLGDPSMFQLKIAEGEADIRVRSGRVLGVNAGLGRILGLLSFENLVRRRLQLDFTDVLKQGFVFDTLESQLIFKNGFAKTNNLFMEGPAAKIKIAGEANLNTKGIDLRMIVVPKVSNTLPLAAGLATGNPVVGIGVWMLDKVTGSKMSEISQYSYRVRGTWEAPTLQQGARSPPRDNRSRKRERE